MKLKPRELLLLEVLVFIGIGGLIFLWWPRPEPPVAGLYVTTPVHKMTDPKADRDKDGLPDVKEEKLGCDPDNQDTDGDGYPDGLEVEKGFDPRIPCPEKYRK
jgi:hypothetical protein